jgi:hypothetical protein
MSLPVGNKVEKEPISFTELDTNLFEAAKALFPSTDRRYDKVSVLITYWDAEISPDLDRLHKLFERRFGFDVQTFAIARREGSQTAFRERIHDFTKA